MENIFVRIYNYFENHRVFFWGLFILSFCFLAFVASKVVMEEDITKFLPKDEKIAKLNEVFNQSKMMDKIAILVSLKDTSATPQPDLLVAYADDLVQVVEKQLSTTVQKITYNVDDEKIFSMFNHISSNLPIYLEDNDYLVIDSLIKIDKIKATLIEDYHTLESPSSIVLKQIIRQDPIGLSYIALKKLQQLQYDENIELFNNCILTKDRRHLMIFITPQFPPSNTEKSTLLMNGLDSIVHQLNIESYKDIKTEYFGATAVFLENSIQLREDIQLTQSITIIFLIFFIGLYFRRKLAPVNILIPVAFGALFSLSLIYFLKGSISVIAFGTGSVVFGIAVNYSLHLFNHYKHRKDMRQVLRDLSMPLTIGSFTTIGGFLSLLLVKSELLKDLGLFTAFSLIGASLCTLIFLPQLIIKKEKTTSEPIAESSWLDRISSYQPENKKPLVLLILILSLILFNSVHKVGFESDILQMNYMSEPLKEVQNKLNKINSYFLQSVYLVAEGKTVNEALLNNEKVKSKIELLQAKDIIKKHSGVSSVMISDSLQQQRINRWNLYWTNQNKKQLMTNLVSEGIKQKFSANAFDPFKELLYKNYKVISISESEELSKAFLEDLIIVKSEKAMVMNILKVNLEDRQKIYDAFEHDENVTVIDKQYLTNRMVEIIISDFNTIALITSSLVFMVLLLTYGRIELALVSFIPMLITWIWILGIMGIVGLQFNTINIILSALIFGLGDDYSLYIMDGLIQEYKTGKKNLTSYKSSILLSAITTTVGLGVLVFAKHPALKSIAVISIIGMTCVVFISLILIPFFFNMIIIKRVHRKLFPWTIWSWCKSAFAFSYFVLGSILLTLLGFLIIKIPLLGKVRGEKIYHIVLSLFSRSLIYIMANVKKKIINPLNEDFSKPAVVICNHQSFIDILLTVMLYPKLILLTNDWVWKSPFMGAVVRMADYYPVSRGVESSIKDLSEKVKQGYSIIIFPEGTRSKDGQIGRFHKGAFYLSEVLKIDLLPIAIHGTGYTMTKGDFLLKNGQITLKYLPRIKPENKIFGENYSERSKKVGRYFRAEYNLIKLEIEQPIFFHQQLIAGYLYKGPVLEWYMKTKLQLENHYQLFHELLPKEGKFLDAGCGYGFMPYILHFSSPERKFTCIDYDKEKIDVAQHNFLRDESINFICSDILNFEYEKYNGIILADVLHYLLPKQQREVIKKCGDSLIPGGILIIRDGNAELIKRHKGTKLTEFFSTKVFRFNKTTKAGLSFLTGTFLHEISSSLNLECEEIDTTKRTSNIVYLIRKPVVTKIY